MPESSNLVAVIFDSFFKAEVFREKVKESPGRPNAFEYRLLSLSCDNLTAKAF